MLSFYFYTGTKVETCDNFLYGVTVKSNFEPKNRQTLLLKCRNNIEGYLDLRTHKIIGYYQKQNS